MGGGNEFEFWPSHKVFRNKALEKLERICLSYRINTCFPISGKSLFYNIHKYPFSNQDEYFIVLSTLSISKLSVRYLKKLKRKHANVKLLVLILDSLKANSEHLNLVRNKLKSDVWDCILTFDKYEAEEFGYVWFGYIYYSEVNNVPADERESDLYYIGKDKGTREKLIADIYTYMTSKAVDCRFCVVTNSDEKYVENSKLEYMHHMIPYKKVVSQVQSTNCILEILQQNQRAQSIRYFEAIKYNKKLLTNNPHIVELPYYDPSRMKYFRKPEDIDYEWVKERAEFDYHYQHEFSPIYLVNFIKNYYGIG